MGVAFGVTHGVPQVPQLTSSVWRFVQAPAPSEPQRFGVAPEHWISHFPSSQAKPAPKFATQSFPHAPQFWESVSLGTQ